MNGYVTMQVMKEMDHKRRGGRSRESKKRLKEYIKKRNSSPAEKELNQGSIIVKWTSGVDLLSYFYKLIVSVYTVKAF